MSIDIFAQYESEVRSYCRAFPVVFNKAKGAELFDEEGKRYIDFFAGAGSLNYGHNPDFIKEKLIAYLQADQIIHGLDMATTAKRTFLKSLNEEILSPRGLKYKTQFCGPTGTNSVEAALKIARKVTGRTGVFAFQGGFHGMTLGALSATGNQYNRKAAGVPLPHVNFMPFPHGFGLQFDTIDYIESVLLDSSSGIEKPAAVLLETVQAEGGVIVAPVEWLQRLRALCDKHEILMVVDDIQVGCGRTGTFFSFERANIVPDIITLSKSISGYGLPSAVVLIKPEFDQWAPGEHNGTFRGHQLGFVGGAAAISLWQNDNFSKKVESSSSFIKEFIEREILPINSQLSLRGIGMIWGIDCSFCRDLSLVDTMLEDCFKRGLVIENAGRKGQVVKILPPLNIDRTLLEEGLVILKAGFEKYFGDLS